MAVKGSSVSVANEQTVHLRPSYFASRRHDFQRLALVEASTHIALYSGQNLDLVITMDNCFQYMDDIGIGALDIEDAVDKLRQGFSCIRDSGKKLATDNFEFGLKKTQLLGSLITSEEITHIKQKFTQSLKLFRCHKTDNRSSESSISFSLLYLSCRYFQRNSGHSIACMKMNHRFSEKS